ncbi:hypothetical protein KQ51_01701 [Candidatus Izimaplasma bacterium HR1]|jgi:Fe2+ transport system protein B|uniref:hypothetical protein n=1 Tax=Candidatus Izimoplasma sp. HR1 TaxID=1541959 RepID=UPI0004F9243B|nr:hypothetical protein KQ51_01701 [Candidatus Izimaplasma bacterium HR1]
MEFKGNTISLKLFSEIKKESSIIVHNSKVYDPFQSKRDYYVINEVNKLVDSGVKTEQVIKELEKKYLLEEVDVSYDKHQFQENDFKLKLTLFYTGSSDVLRIKFEKDTSLGKLLTVDIDERKLIKVMKYDRVPNEVSDDMEMFVSEFKKHLEKANKMSHLINAERSKMIKQYVEERVKYNLQEDRMKKILDK